MTDPGEHAGYAGLLRNAAQRWPDEIALEFEGDRWTYSELDSAVDTATHRCAAAGFVAGRRVLLLMENRPEYLIAQFALNRLGAVFVTPNPYWTDIEIDHAIDASGADAAVYEPRFASVASRLAAVVSVDDLLSTIEVHSLPMSRDGSEPAYIPFSSGTTGLPKGVLHTDSSLRGAVDQLRHHLALSRDDRLQLSLPLCHIFGATMSAAAISAGAHLALFRRFDLDESLDHIESSGVTVWPLAGAGRVSAQRA